MCAVTEVKIFLLLTPRKCEEDKEMIQHVVIKLRGYWKED